MATPLSQSEFGKMFPELADSKKRPKGTPKQDAKGSLKAAWIIFAKEPWPFEPEYRFNDVRKWRFDWACPDLLLAIEIEGLTHYGKGIGRHQNADGAEKDMEKYNDAAAHGWCLLRYSQRMIKSNPHGIVQQIQQVIQMLRME